MSITLRQLQVFTSIVQEGSITAAALRLHLTKPAVSTALNELERRCGHLLFDRHRNRLHLNDLGHRLLPLADELLQRSRDIDSLFAPDAAGADSLRIGASFTIGHQLVPWLLHDYRRESAHPRQTVRIDNTRRVCEQLASFELDIGLIEGEPELECIETTNWMTDHMLIAASPKHPLAAGKRVSLKDLNDQEWVLREAGSGSRNLFLYRLAPRLGRWRTALECNATEALINASAAGLGLSCISNLEARHALDDGRLVEVPVVDLDLRRQFRLAWHRQKYHSPTLDDFIRYCIDWHETVAADH